MAIVNDETSRILAEHGTPERWRAYVLMEAERMRREAIEAAYAAYVAAGGDLAAITRAQQAGQPAYGALRSAIQDAVTEYDQTCGQIRAEFSTQVNG
jgi:hypothetical protein